MSASQLVVCVGQIVRVEHKWHSLLLTVTVHYAKNDMALGHEGVGIVEQLGPDVKYLKKGDRVGWGYEHDSCGHCEQCLKGEETYCAERAMYGEC